MNSEFAQEHRNGMHCPKTRTVLIAGATALSVFSVMAFPNWNLVLAQDSDLPPIIEEAETTTGDVEVNQSNLPPLTEESTQHGGSQSTGGTGSDPADTDQDEGSPPRSAETGAANGTEGGGEAPANESAATSEPSQSGSLTEQSQGSAGGGGFPSAFPGPAASPGADPAPTDLAGPLTPGAHGLTCLGSSPCIIDKTGQPMRVLPRSQSPLRASPDPEAEVLQSALPGFSSLYVFGLEGLDLSDPANPTGFYHVGKDNSGPAGFLAARDALEWRQALILQFEHPGQGEDKRNPTLFFESEQSLRDVVSASDRSQRVQTLRQSISEGTSDGGVIAREPATYVDITEKLYIYPILEWRRDVETIEKARYMKVLTATPGRRSTDAADAIANNRVAEEETAPASLDELDVDIVFVIDMTGSMQPYIDEVRNAVRNGAESFGQEFADARQVRFGLVGYRDNVERTPALEFQTRNFTKEQLVSIEGLESLLGNDGQRLASKTSSDEWAEALLPGVEAAISDTPWTSSRSLRLVAIVGDASGHEPGTEAYPEGMDSASIRRLATDRNVQIVGVYVENERAKVDWDRATAQLATLTTNPGSSAPNFGTVSAEAAGFIETFLIQFAQDSRANAESALNNQGEASGLEPEPEPVNTNPQDIPAKEIAERWGEALTLGIVDYLGDAQEAPVDFTGWVLDNDLASPNRRAVGVRVLTSRADLDNVIRRQEVILRSLEDEKITQSQFFESLQDLSARAGLDVDISRDQSFRQSNFLPKWISALPYKSEVLDLSPRDFEELNAQERRELRLRIGSKLEAYRAIMSDTTGWFALDPNAEAIERVYALDIEALP